MSKPWGIIRPCAEFSEIAGQYDEKVKQLNDRNPCISPNYIPSVSTEGKELKSIELQAVRCRKCEECLKMRQRLWMRRAAFEYELHDRTWWCTFTYRGDSEKSYEDVKLFFKKLRKKHEFRYLISEERGEKNDRLHWHALLHCRTTLTKRSIESAWSLGNSKLRLARTENLGAYMAKYAAKQSRIRASRYYGEFGPHLYDLFGKDFENQIEQYLRTGRKDGFISGTGITAHKYGQGIRMSTDDLRYIKSLVDIPW